MEEKKKRKGLLLVPIVIVLIVVAIIIIVKLLGNDDSKKIKNEVSIALDHLVEKSELETANITYNVIAKSCKKENCNMNSNQIKDFKYVVACDGTVTASIDFTKVKIDVDSDNKKIVITIPDVVIGDDPYVLPKKILNGEKTDLNSTPEITKLCKDTVVQKSKNDEKLLPAAKEQAVLLLNEFYAKWIDAYGLDYTVEVK